MLRGFLLCCIFFLSGTNAFARIEVPDYLEKGQVERARPMFQEVVLRYTRARKNYREKGPEAFVDSLSEKISPEDKKEILLLLAKLPEIPEVSVANDTLTFKLSTGKTMEFSTADVISGRFNYGKYSKRYNYNSSPKENWESFKLKDKKNISWIDSLESFSRNLLPLAEAQEQNPTERDIGVIVIGSLTKAVVLPRLGYVNYGPNNLNNH